MRSVLLTGLLGSTCVAFGGFLVGRTPPGDWVEHVAPLGGLREGAAAAPLGYGAAFLGLALLTWAWVGLGARTRGRPDGVAAVRRAALLWVLPLLPTPPLFSGDGWSYVGDGLLTARGLSPYDVSVSHLHGPILQAVDAAWLHTTAQYGPLPMLWGGAASWTWGDLWFGLYAFRALALVGLGLLLYAVPRLAAATGRDPASATWLAAASPLVLAHGVAGLHLDLVMVGLMALALMLAATHRWGWASVAVGLAVAVKPTAVFVVVGVVLLSMPHDTLLHRLRRAAAVSALALATAVGLGEAGGLGLGWVGAMRVPWAHPSWLSLTRYVGDLAAWVTGLRVTPAVPVAGVVLLCAVSAWLVLRGPVRDRAAAGVAAAVALALSTAMAPVVHYWYFLWCLPALACAPLARVPRRAVVALVVALGVLAPVDPSQHLPFGTTVVRVSLVLAVLVAFLPSGLLGRWVPDRLQPAAGA
ncbi:MAG: polyprenol phosphomannose-dependent alpha 1,6 mannosyltransferase MptB [Nocardioides sp.]